MSRTLGTLVLALALMGPGCGGTAESPPVADDVVFVVNEPLHYFARTVGADVVDVRFPAPAAVDPAFWTPDDATIRGYQSAALVLRNGAGYARWIERAALADSRVVNTTRGVENLIEIEDGPTHSHGSDPAHSHKGTAFTTWLDFEIATVQLNAVTEAFIARWPEHSSAFTTRAAQVVKVLRTFDDDTRAIARHLNAQPVICSHPVYQYWARRYGFNARSVHWEADEMPSAAEWETLSALCQAQPARWMIWEGEPLPEIRARLDGMGLRSVVWEPCGNRSVTGKSFPEVMAANIARLRKAVGL